MKRTILSIAVLGVLGILSAPSLANGYPPGKGAHPNIVKVNQYYHGAYHGNYHGGYHGPYFGGTVVYNALPPLWNYHVPSTLFSPVPPLIAPPVYTPYYYYPSASFYYSSPELSIGVGF